MSIKWETDQWRNIVVFPPKNQLANLFKSPAQNFSDLQSDMYALQRQAAKGMGIFPTSQNVPPPTAKRNATNTNLSHLLYASNSATTYTITGMPNTQLYINTSATDATTDIPGIAYPPVIDLDDLYYKIQDGKPCNIKLPDGTKIHVNADGSYEINDKEAKTIYKANRIREFNSFINASNHIEDFIKYCGTFGIKRDDMLNLPIKLFIGWLVLEAAKADKEPEPNIAILPDLRKVKSPKCVSCGKFIKLEMARKKLTFCKPVCFETYYRRAA